MNYLCIAFIVCFIVDVSGFMESLKYGIFRLLFGRKAPYRDYRLKPLDCSLCMTFWSCLAYSLIAGEFGFRAFVASCALALLAENITQLMYAVKDLIGALTNKLTDRIDL